jgi:restriction endonuclease S subunit
MSEPLKQPNLTPNPEWAKLPLFDRSGWRRLPFGAFAESVNERVEPANAADEIYVGLDDLDSGSLHIRRWGKGSDVIGTKLRFRQGDLIFGRRRAYQRKLAVAEMDGICSAHALVVRAKPEFVLPEFLPFLMMSDKFMNRAVEISVGSLSPTINWTALKLQEFDLPPLDQQRRFAEILWAVDEATEGYEKSEASYLNAIESVRRHHFTESTKQHTLVSVRDVGRWFSGKTPSRDKDEFWNGAFPWVSPKDMKSPVINDAEEHLSEAGRKESVIVSSGCLLLVIRGMILAHSFPLGITQREVAFNQDMKALAPYESHSVDYLFNWFKWATPAILSRISDSSHGTKRLAMDDLFEMKVPLLSLVEQQKFVERIKELDESHKVIRNSAERLRLFSSVFLNSIFKVSQ